MPSSTSNLDASTTWSHRFNQFLTLRISYQFLRQTNDSTPHFANRVNVSGSAGIAGNDQEPVNWGPPALVFSSGIAGLGNGSVLQAGEPHPWVLVRGAVADARRPQLHVRRRASAADALTSSGSRTRAARSASTDRSPDRMSRISCWVRRIPRPSRSATPTNLLRGRSANAYITDDWRINPTLTVNLGASMGIRSAVQRRARPSRESRRGAGLHWRRRPSSAPS